jgi:hypothetical protein
MRHYLVVANQTLGGADLDREIRERASSGECEFWVLVPATPSQDIVVAPLGGLAGSAVVSAASSVNDEGAALAEARLDKELERLRAAGIQADGEIGDPDPIHAIRDTLQQRKFDEIILATLPQGISRWLRQDLPHQVRRKFGLPLTHVVAS